MSSSLAASTRRSTQLSALGHGLPATVAAHRHAIAAVAPTLAPTSAPIPTPVPTCTSASALAYYDIRNTIPFPTSPDDPRTPTTRAASLSCSLRFATNPSARHLASSLAPSSTPLAYPYSTPSRAHTRDPTSVLHTPRFEAQNCTHKARQASMCKPRNPPRLPKNDNGLYPRPNNPYTGFGAARSEEMRCASAVINERFGGIGGVELENEAGRGAVERQVREAGGVAAPAMKQSLSARVANRLGLSQRR